MRPTPAPPRTDLLATLAAASLLVAALLFGGGPRGLGDLVVHLAALPCLALGITRWRWTDASRVQRAFFAWWLLALALVALQLMPLPPSLFAKLPQRASVLADLASAGVAPSWRPLTLDTWATVRALLALATFGAMWLLASTLPHAARARLLQLALLVGAVLALFGFAQAAAGQHALRFHAFHHSVGAIGTFANRNHYASLMAMLLPFALAFASDAQRARNTPLAAAWFALAIALWLAAALSFSRMGFALASCALLASLALLWLRRGQARRWFAPALAAAVALLAITHYAWNGLLQRLQQDPLDDLRWQYLRHGVAVLRDYLPWGSGLGSFPWVYAPAEPVQRTIEVYAERAHNDLLQVGIEAGMPGLVLLVAFIALNGAIAARAPRNFPMGRNLPAHDDGARRVIAVALAIPLLHSLVDYPYRTLAVAVLAGLVLALGSPVRDARA
jgi:hypothetical protein